MKVIFIVEATAGEWEPWSWLVKAFETEEAARTFAAQAEAYADEAGDAYEVGVNEAWERFDSGQSDTYDRPPKPRSPFDARWDASDGRVSYVVRTVEMDE